MYCPCTSNLSLIMVISRQAAWMACIDNHQPPFALTSVSSNFSEYLIITRHKSSFYGDTVYMSNVVRGDRCVCCFSWSRCTPKALFSYVRATIEIVVDFSHECRAGDGESVTWLFNGGLARHGTAQHSRYKTCALSARLDIVTIRDKRHYCSTAQLRSLDVLFSNEHLVEYAPEPLG